MTLYPATEPFDRTRHRVDDFSCGDARLDLWLQAYAAQSQRRDAARTFVVADPGGGVHGYHTLVAAEVARDAATSAVRRGLSRRFPVAVVLIARLAVDRGHQRRGLGRSLLLDALSRAERASRELGVRAVLVDAIDDEAVAFYRRYGEPSELDPMQLMVTMSAVRGVLGGG